MTITALPCAFAYRLCRGAFALLQQAHASLGPAIHSSPPLVLVVLLPMARGLYVAASHMHRLSLAIGARLDAFV